MDEQDGIHMCADIIKEASDKCWRGKRQETSHIEAGKRHKQRSGQENTWFVDGVRDEVLPQLCVILLFGKFYGFVHILQLLHDHLQSPSAVPHPAWVQRYIHHFLIALRSGKMRAPIKLTEQEDGLLYEVPLLTHLQSLKEVR